MATASDAAKGIIKLEWVQFLLTKTDANKQAWNDLLNHPGFERSVPITLAFETSDIESLRTEVHPKPAVGFHEFNLIVIRKGMPLALGIVVWLGSVLFFLRLMKSTTIIRDTTAEPRPDGQYPFSLARTQMAFWFFLVMGSYFLLWIITGDQDTISSSALVLIGISAGTAFGAAVVDAGKVDTRTGFRPPTNPDLSKRLTDLRKIRDDLLGELKHAQDRLNANLLSSASEAELLPDRQAVSRLGDSYRRTQEFVDFYQRRPWERMVYDLLGDSGAIGFHRFQVAVATLILGIVFATQIYYELSMPNFSATLLGLMGISAGTYVGFKIPEGRRNDERAK